MWNTECRPPRQRRWIIVQPSGVTPLQRGNAVRDAPRHPATPSAGQWCSRVARNFTSGQRSSIRARFTRVGAR
ncbi:DUF1534 domain-containing protein [Pseudomonas syringae USA011]|nr:DUF1534 domain-containing protein [Pseudomonas syringae USA011]